MKKGAYFTLTVLGFVLTVVGLCYLKSTAELRGYMRVLPYVCIGIGCGAFGHGLGEILSQRAVKNSQELQRQIEIEKKDERNVTISNRAKAKAYNAMIYILGALIVSFSLMNLELYVILLLVFAYLLVIGISVYYRCKYDKEM